VAIENAFGMIDTTFTNIPGGTEVPFTYTPTSETRIYPLVVEDAECAYHFADSGDTLTLHMRSDVITPCNVITTHDTVCYGGSGHLTATLQLQGHPVDANHPTSVRWFADYNMTHELKSEILTGGFSYYDTAGLTQRTVLYVSLNQDNICPSINGVTTNVHSMENGASTELHCADAIRYYDPGGRDGDYPVSGNGSYFETFHSYDGRPVAIHFDSLDLAVPSKLYIFTGTEAIHDSLIYTVSYGTVPPDIILSNGPYMSLMFSPGPVSAKGWEAVVSPAPGIAIAEVLPQNIVRFADEVCHIGGDDYTPPFEGWERVVSQIVLDSLLNDPETSGLYTFQKHFTDSHGCDSLVRFDLTVGIQPVCLDTTIVILSTDTAGIVWHGKAYKETGQYYYTIAGTGDETHCDCVERLSLIVLDVKVHDNEMCEGDDALMVIEVSTPNIKRDFPDRTTVGDIYCERYVQTSTGAFTQMLFIDPEKFAAQRQFDSLTPLGVVFYVDPDVTEARVVSLTDAFRGALPWARTEVMTSVQSVGLKTSMESSVEDFDGKANTDMIKQTAELATDKNFQLNAPAAFFCYYFDPKAAEVPSSLDDPNTRYNTPTDWYLPSAGEVSVFRANRGLVNKTIEKLIELGYSAEYPDPPYDPDHPGYYKGSAYWSSTESNTNHQMAWFLQAKGQMNGHKTKDYTINVWDNNEEHYCVRAVKKVNL
jgi:hypothetical protein